MFGFKRAKPDAEKVAAFCNWFLKNNTGIIESVENRENAPDKMHAMLDEVELQLAYVYRDGYNGVIEFDYGFNGQKWDLNLYHNNKKFLKEVTSMIAEQLNSILGDTWSVNTSI